MCTVILTGTLVGLLPSKAGLWLAEVQFMYLLLAGAIGWIALWLGLTLVFGRIYCSSVCPLGTLIDLGSRLTRRRKRYRFAPARNALRYTILVAFGICTVIGITFVTGTLSPESAYANITVGIFRPAVNLWKGLTGHPAIRLMTAGGLGALIGAVTLIVTGIFSRKGRLYCNTVCPVGSILSLVSRNAVMHIDINTDLCTHCGKCADVCKASCIDLKDHVADMSRCVNCFNCLDVCEDSAISYTSRRHTLSTPMMQKIKNQLRPRIPQPTLNMESQQTKNTSHRK